MAGAWHWRLSRKVAVIATLFAFLAICGTAEEWTSLESALEDVPEDWTDLGPSDGTKAIRLVFAIQQDDAQLESLATNVSDPNHADHGNFM